jgi:hypothetical protein
MTDDEVKKRAAERNFLCEKGRGNDKLWQAREEIMTETPDELAALQYQPTPPQ